jgi:hypothetical protein
MNGHSKLSTSNFFIFKTNQAKELPIIASFGWLVAGG